MPGKAQAVPLRDRAVWLAHPAVALLAVAVLGYGLLLPQLGFYWDELPMSWIRYELGPAAMTKYFSTNRPAWGMLYQLTTAVLPQIPVYWQVFCLVLRWALCRAGVADDIRPMAPASRTGLHDSDCLPAVSGIQSAMDRVSL